MNGAKLNASIVALQRLSARTETGEVRINSSKLREEHSGIGKNGGVFL